MDKLYCNNCNKYGHKHKDCTESIKSWGIILIKQNKLLLIRRKHTVGYSDFIRGIYNENNSYNITSLFKQMTPEEIKKINSLTFTELWLDLLGTISNDYLLSKDIEKAKKKYNYLINDADIKLNYYIQNIIPSYEYPEWGFPKGRKKGKEDELICAKREFCEETGLCENDINIISQEPYIEEFLGTNGKKYTHIYYIAKAVNDNLPNIKNNVEIGDIGYYTIEDAKKLIRNYHLSRLEILKKLETKFIDF